MIKVLLFDFYGVFIPDSYSAWLERNGLKREGVFEQLINKRDRDAISEPEFLATLSDMLGREVTADEIHCKDPQIDQELIKTIKQLKPLYKIGLLSNASSMLRPRLQSLGLTDIFDEIIISSEIGHAKPSNEAFTIAIQRLGVPSAAVLFIDDNPKNLEAAHKNGLQTVLYTSIRDVRSALGNY